MILFSDMSLNTIYISTPNLLLSTKMIKCCLLNFSTGMSHRDVKLSIFKTKLSITPHLLLTHPSSPLFSSFSFNGPTIHLSFQGSKLRTPSIPPFFTHSLLKTKTTSNSSFISRACKILAITLFTFLSNGY